MKILLVLPFNVYGGKYDNKTVLSGGGEAEIPLGLCYIKAYIKKQFPDIDIKIYDSNIDALNYIINHDNKVEMETLRSRLRKVIEDYGPDVVGVSAFSHAIAGEAHKILAISKEMNKDIFTVMGGSYPTLSYDCAMEDPNLDVVVQSEGEIVFYNLVKAITNRKPISGIKGIAYRDKDKVIVNPLEEKIADLDMLPFPDLDDISVELYGKLPRHSLQRIIDDLKPFSIVSARGCVFQCGFCATKKVWGTIRYRDPKKVMEEIKYLKSKYDINFIKINDDLFTLNPDRVIEICDLFIKEKPVEKWCSTGTAVYSLLHKEMVKKMVESGYHAFALPIESGCENTLKKINKPLKLNIVKEAVQHLRQYDDIFVGGGFIVGFPFETKEDIQQTYDLADSLDLNWATFNMFTPFPKTKLYEDCIKEGYLKNKKIKYDDLQNTNVLTTPNFTKEWLIDNKYLNNLKINFVHNYHLKKEDYQSAIDEFKFILKIAPDHAFALLLTGYAHDKLENKDQADLYFKKAEDIFKQENFWSNYLKSLKDDLESSFKINTNKFMVLN